MEQRPAAAQRVASVVVMTTAMLTFISFWRAGAVVLCDMASTAYYIGGIAERAIGQAAPWFILAVMGFSACMLAVYVEGSSMYVRGGVYKVVKEALGGHLAKVSVSALMFDYVLTGPISSVSAGQYLAGLLNAGFPYLHIGWRVEPRAFSVFFALCVTAYFWRQNICGIEESSDKAAKIIWLTSLMALALFGWSAWTLRSRGFEWPPLSLSFGPEALGWLEHVDWAHTIGAVGVLVGIGHAFLGMSGLESLAQVYREMEAPKLKNLKRAAVFIFLFAFALTTFSTFFAATIIPDGTRVHYLDNLLSGLAMSLEGPRLARLLMQAFVVVVGALILSGAVNTSVMGANGVLNRLAEDGILADWFRWLHPKYGTTHRMINLLVALQVVTIIACRGDVYLLGEAYAFGVIWSFVFKTTALLVLRFKDRSPREWRVPINLRLGGLDLPVGLSAILAVLVLVAATNLLTKKVATIWGLAFTAGFYLMFWFSEKLHERRAGGHREKLNLRNEKDFQGVLRETEKQDRVLVAVKNPGNLHGLARVLGEIDPETTEVVVLHSKIARGLQLHGTTSGMGPDEELLFTNVIEVAEKQGKTVVPLLVVSNDPSFAIAQAAQSLGAREVVLGISGLIGAEDQVERLAMTWGALGNKTQAPLKVRVLWPDGKKLEAELA